MKKALLFFAVLLLPALQFSRVATFTTPSSPVSANYTTPAVKTESTLGATITINFSTLTLPDADDELRLFVQTSYDDGATYVDCQNLHFDADDNGTTPLLTAPIDEKVDGPGLKKTITGTNPVAGSEWTETVPENAIWKIRNIQASFTTDSTVTDRRPGIFVDNGADVFYSQYTGTAHTASTTWKYVFLPEGEQLANAVATVQLTLPPDLVLSGGNRLRSSTNNMQAGDNWGAPQYKVEEWHNDSVLTDGSLRDNVRSYNRPMGTHLRIKAVLAGATAGTYNFTATVMWR